MIPSKSSIGSARIPEVSAILLVKEVYNCKLKD